MSDTSEIIREDLEAIARDLRPYYERLEGKTLLIAGGAGFLGRYMVSTLHYLNASGLLSSPCRVVLVDNFVSGVREWIPTAADIELVQHDVKDPLRIEGPVDFLINAASIASPVFYNRLRLETIDAGIFGTKNLLELAREKEVESFLFLSSSEVYGDPDPDCVPTSEEYLGNVSCVGPRACYDEPKRMGETLCVNYAEVYNLPVKIARPFNIFGPGIRLDDGRVVPTFVVSAILGKHIPVHGDGTKTRTFCYISNATAGFFRILFSDRNGEVYNIGADDPEIQIRHLATLVHGLVMNNEGGIDLVPGPSDVYTESNPERRCPDLSKIRTQLGYETPVDLVTGLKRLIVWVGQELDLQYGSARFEEVCRVCGCDEMKEFLNLGNSPLANRLLDEGDLSRPVEAFPLAVAWCPTCYGCQLTCTVDPDEMFRNYPYVTSTTETLRAHFGDMARTIVSRFELPRRALVVDVGSNDGLLLGKFKEEGMDVLGVEPAENIAELARDRGIDTIADYFDRGAVDAIVKLKGRAKIVTANNVFAHTALIDDFLDNAQRLLDDEGVLVLEVQYLKDTLADLTFDNVYHEHVSYFSVLSLRELFRRRNMQLFDVEHVETHGGSIRVYVQKLTGSRTVEASVEAFVEAEYRAGLNEFRTYEAFARQIYDMRDRLKDYVSEIRTRDETLVGYGAPAKATTLLNFIGVGTDVLDYVVDDNPLKQGRYIPGVRIPIRSREALEEARPDNVLILAWNFADEIMAKNADLRAAGARFIVPLPEPRIV